MINLYIASEFTSKVIGFDNEEFVSLHLADFEAQRITSKVWELADGSFASLSETDLENFYIDRMSIADYQLFEEG